MMDFVKQTWTLTRKNLLIVFWRHWVATLIRAFVAPIIFQFFISYAKNFFVPPSEFGIGPATPLRSFEDALHTAGAGRNTVAFANNGYTGGAIDHVIAELVTQVEAAGKTAVRVHSSADLLIVCPSSLRGVTPCFGAVDFTSSPTEGPNGTWTYTLLADGALGSKIFVDQTDNDQQIYPLPFQHAIDSAIVSLNGSSLPTLIEQYPFTYETNEQRAQMITRLYQGTVISILAVAFVIGVVGVTYQLVGHMATEREIGMSQLIEAMMPNKRRWQPQVARILASHIAFDIMYLPSWIIMGAIVAGLVFPNSNYGITIGAHILVGLALTSWSILFGSFFRKAQLSGITTVIVTLVLAIIAQVAIGANGALGTIVVLSLLFPPMTFTFFLIWIAQFQQKEIPANLSQASPSSISGITGITFFGLFIVQIIFFPILGAIFERYLYSTASRDRKFTHSEDAAPVAVRLTNFSKHYGASWFKRNILCCGRRKYKNDFVAVNDLSLELLRGQICVLLGANGSGKSTTLDAIAGLNTITRGSIEVDGTGGLGLCPQKNVLWDEITVAEHVRIFNHLKSPGAKASKAENTELISACDLDIKLNAKSHTLSGGQKRKLQLAMMFTGGSRVCAVDEVSSGIDPLARRKIWDILLAERGRRTILLTTHFLDEADVLSDHIAILSKGNLKAEGTAVELKHSLGSGYRVWVAGHDRAIPEAGFESVPRHVDYDQTVYHFTNQSDVSRFINALESAGFAGDYRVQGPTVEDVFLRLADELKDDFGVGGAVTPPKSPKSADDQSTASSEVKDHGKNEIVTVSGLTGKRMDLLPGHGTGLFRQGWVLFRKRLTVLRYNYLPYIALCIVPIIAAGAVTLFLQGGFQPLSCDPSSNARFGDIEGLIGLYDADIVYGPSSRIPADALYSIYPFLNRTAFHAVGTIGEFNSFIDQNYANVTPGGFFIPGGSATPTFAYIGNYDIGSSVLAQGLLNNFLGGVPILAQYQSFAIPWAPRAGSTLQLILYFGLAMSAYPGFFALYPTAERLRKVRALHYSNGVRSGPLWSAYVIFDFLFVLLVSVIAIILFTTQWGGWYYPGELFVVFFLYGLTSIAYSYVISLFTTSQLAAFAFSAGTQAVLYLLYFISYLAIITYAPVNAIDHYVTLAHFTIGLITPAGNLLRALLLTLNEFSLTCKGDSIGSFGGDITLFGGPILYLIGQFVVLFAFLVYWDGGGRFRMFKRSTEKTQNEEEHLPSDVNVAEELSRVATSNDGLRVLNMTKAFGSNVAVEDVTFGIRKSEVFALLGPNGAGKSTTISLIRGDLRPSNNHGDVFVEGNSLKHHRNATRNHLGVCPQFDAIDHMTVRGHLEFYARVRGVSNVNHNVSEVMRAVGLNSYAGRIAGKLSGGNKRKLSLGIALIGNPAVLLLDEPSSGMDAAAKRVMWKVLASVTDERALLITTHSMEEADALATRAGILAKRMLALGTTEELRKRHGDAYYIHLVHKEAPHTSAAEMERVKQWVRENIPAAHLEDRTYHGQLRFSVPNAPTAAATTRAIAPRPASSADGKEEAEPAKAAGAGIGALFNLLESHKEELGFAYYTVMPTTLDQVFLNVVRQHNIEEENYGRGQPVKKDKKRSTLRAMFGKSVHNAM